MRSGWRILPIIVIGIGLGLAVGGFPNSHSDVRLHVRATTSTTGISTTSTTAAQGTP